MIKEYPLREYIAHLLINTPLEQPAVALRRMKSFRVRRKKPELQKISREGPLTKKIMKCLLRGSMNCIDVGAHLGSMLSQILRFSPHGNHFAIEPIPYKAQWLRSKFPRVEVHQIAVSDVSSTATFHYYPHKSGFSGLGSRRQLIDSEIQFTVRCERLDDIIPLERHIDFIKVDIEGNELKFFHGAQRILQQYQPSILFECTKGGLISADLQPHEIFNFLTQQHHYSVFFLEDWLAAKKPLDVEQFSNAIMCYPFQAFNFLATTKPAQANTF